MSAADDIIGTLSARVTELSKRVALLEAELKSAEQRLSIYEEHDQSIQDAISASLKAAYSIRQRAEVAAEQVLEAAREQRRMILSEIERLQDERDRLQDEIASHRRSGISAVSTSRPTAAPDANTVSELRAAASEALKGLFQEIVDDMRAAQQRTVPHAPEAPRREETRREPEPTRAPEAPRRAQPAASLREEVAPAQPPTYEAMARMRRTTVTEEEDLGMPPIVAAPEPTPAVARSAPVIEEPATPIVDQPAPMIEEQAAPMAEVDEIEEPAAPMAEDPAAVEELYESPAPVAELDDVLAAEPLPEAIESEAVPIEEEEATPTAEAPVAPVVEEAQPVEAPAQAHEPPAPPPTPGPAPSAWTTVPHEAPAPEPVRPVASVPPPLEVVRTASAMTEFAPPRVEAASPTSDIQLVLSPVPSFPRLVEIERRIQALSVVRTLYVRDFRGGTATLAVALRSSMTPEEFAGMLASLQQPRMRLVAGSRNTLELRIEGEAGVA